MTRIFVALFVVFGVSAVIAFHCWSRTAGTVTRWGRRSRRKSGVASTWDVLWVASWWRMKRLSRVIRPTFDELSWWQRWTRKTIESAIPLCRVGLLRVWASMEDVVMLIGIPRMGKTGWFAGRVIDAPGAVLATTTKPDLYHLTAGLRAQHGPVYVFNPAGTGKMPSTITFNPLTGCTDPETALERAADMLGPGGADEERQFWVGQARRVLGAFMHAAALGGLSMSDVLAWVADPKEHSNQITNLLHRSPARNYVQDAAQFISTNERTQTSITSTIMPALAWLTSPTATAAASGEVGFDVVELIRSKATIFLLGKKTGHITPLVTALTGHIAREARNLADAEPMGRLDPPLTLALDEAALICPVPLDDWTADMGGRGINIIIAVQSRAQLIEIWGQAGAGIILNNTAHTMLFGGTSDSSDLDHWVTLVGERDEPVETRDNHGRVVSRTVRRVPVLSAAQISNLWKFRVIVFRQGMPPALGRVEAAWRRRDVKAQLKLDKQANEAVLQAAEDAKALPVKEGTSVDADA